MSTTQAKFTTSINIIRDSGREIKFIPTPNSRRVMNQIEKDFTKGIRSFNIIGSYGTGKSSFLWALQQSLQGRKNGFEISLLRSTTVEFINFIGEYRSIIEVFASYFGVQRTGDVTQAILSKISERYKALAGAGPLLVLVIDEFGKFLEFASHNSPEKELYFIQQLSEFANDPDRNIVLLTAVHQNFDAYGFALSNAQKQEWTKVKGRFREITFNEPVEQLIFLASEHLKQENLEISTREAAAEALAIANQSRAFGMNPHYAKEVSLKLFPLDLIASSILTILLQKYGQNERSLFSFLESTDKTGISSFDRSSNPFYNVACVYDYLSFNFYAYITSRYNPDFAAWARIRNSLEEIERLFEIGYVDYAKIVKTIGLLNIAAAAGSDLGREFLARYAKVCLGVTNAPTLIHELEEKKLILFRNHSKRFVLFEGTDLDIPSALIEAGDSIGDIKDIPTILNRYYHLPPVMAKSYSYRNGTPRLFEFRISKYPVSEVPQGEIDGFINLIFNENLALEELKSHSATEAEAVVFGFYLNAKAIKDLLFEIEKTAKVIQDNEHDKAATRELSSILTHQKNLLNHHILNNLYSHDEEVVWLFRGKEIKIGSKRDLNRFLSKVCLDVYTKTPIFRNELVNKHRISSSIHTAKRNFLKALVNDFDKPGLGFPEDKFPPEKTIFLTLLEEQGISLCSEDPTFAPEVSESSSFIHLWNYSIDFLNSTKTGRRRVSELSEPLTKRPFKLKQGLIDFWIPSFLFVKRDDFAVFGKNGYIPYLTEEVLELIVKNPQDYEIKAFDIDGVKLEVFNSYRLLLNQHSREKLDNQTFIETIKPFLTFYKSLPEYSKKTSRMKKATLAVRNAIANSEDPERTFFHDFPAALGFSPDELKNSTDSLSRFTNALSDAIRELRTSYSDLLNRFEGFIVDEFIGEPAEFEDYKVKLHKRFDKLKTHFCLPHQKTFVQRINSKLDDKQAWLSSIAQSVIGKALETIRDDDEIVLYDKFKAIVHELDSLTNISAIEVDDKKEDVLSVEISSLFGGVEKSIVRLPKSKRNSVIELENSIKSDLSGDRLVDIAALVTILKELMKK